MLVGTGIFSKVPPRDDLVSQSPTMQPSFEGFCPATEAVEQLARNSGIEQRGAIYTKREVVDFILDLTGYRVGQPLTRFRVLEPSFGNSDFMLPLLKRLLTAAQRESNGLSFVSLQPAIRGVELHKDTFDRNREAMRTELITHGVSRADATQLLDVWLLQGDFLLCDFDQDFTHVIGNPPYVRQESIPGVLLGEYRKRYNTVYDRADIYIPFIEQSLRLLAQGGKLGFICADRWMKNRYGRKLRELVSREFTLSTYVDMVGTDAFQSEVSAYPAITIIERGRRPWTRVYARPKIDAKALEKLSIELTSKKLSRESQVREIENIASGSEPWILESFEELALVRCLEKKFPPLEQAGCKVGIGVATGADKAFIDDFESLDVEPCRKLPLVMTKDIQDGHVAWRGKGVVNPFGEDGKLVRLEDFPKLRTFLNTRKEQIARRHVAIKAPQNWYRTIDRIYPELARREKLLIPDIKGDATIVYEEGRLYPHHNLYFIVSDEWDIRALQAVMRSGIAQLFVSLYSTKMRGGYLRFQAQYLRRIRIPSWKNVDTAMRKRLLRVAETGDAQERNAVTAELYGLTRSEMKSLAGSGPA